MKPREEFLVIETADGVAVYTPLQYPLEVPIGPDAQRLGVHGPSLVYPPRIHLTRAEFDDWRRQIESEGYTVTLGPFWRDPDMLAQGLEAVRRGDTISLEDFRNELLGRADGAGREEDRPLEAVEPPAS